MTFMQDPTYTCTECWETYDSLHEMQSCLVGHLETNPGRDVTYADGSQRKLTGGSSGYYKVEIKAPTSGGVPYAAECNDIIEALNMEYDVANVFKAAWRIAALRQGHGKPGQDNPVYDAEKVVFFGNRIIAREKSK